jgi:hypothetical protein
VLARLPSVYSRLFSLSSRAGVNRRKPLPSLNPVGVMGSRTADLEVAVLDRCDQLPETSNRLADPCVVTDTGILPHVREETRSCGFEGSYESPPVSW